MSFERHTPWGDGDGREFVQFSVCWAAVALLFLTSLAAGCRPAVEARGPNSSQNKKTRVAGQVRHEARRPTAAPADEGKSPIVVIHTSCGDVTVRLDYRRAPETVKNFLDYVDNGHYDGTIFHQVARDRMVLGGGFTPRLVEKPPLREPVVNEASNGLSNRRGTIAMARRLEAPDSATCQFYINLGDNDELDHRDRSVDGFGYCVFGEVLSGLEVVEQIASAEVTDTEKFDLLPIRTVLIKTVKRVK
jgi:cyclophilin family peptidyl-prolyl cis-trans isomerase